MATTFMTAAHGQRTHSAQTNTFMPAAQGQRTHSAQTKMHFFQGRVSLAKNNDGQV